MSPAVAEALAQIVLDADAIKRRAQALLPPVDPAAEAMTDRALAAQHASEGKRPLARRRPALICPSIPPRSLR